MLYCLFIAALWSPAGKGLTSCLSCVWCFLVFLSHSHVVSWVGCGVWFYRFLIFAFILSSACPDLCLTTESLSFQNRFWYIIRIWGCLRSLKKIPLGSGICFTRIEMQSSVVAAWTHHCRKTNKGVGDDKFDVVPELCYVNDMFCLGH